MFNIGCYIFSLYISLHISRYNFHHMNEAQDEKEKYKKNTETNKKKTHTRDGQC